MPAAESCAAWLLLAVLAPAQAGPGDDAPSAELLLHLAEFGDADDQYLEPLDLERATTVQPDAPAAAAPRERKRRAAAAGDEVAPYEPDRETSDDAPR